MTEFQTVARIGDIPEGEGRAYPLAGTMVAVFFVENEYFAINDFCPHMGASLSAGGVEGKSVFCPWHAWQFCLTDGHWMEAPSSPLRSASYPVRVVGDEIQIQVEPPEEKTDAAES